MAITKAMAATLAAVADAARTTPNVTVEQTTEKVTIKSTRTMKTYPDGSENRPVRPVLTVSPQSARKLDVRANLEREDGSTFSIWTIGPDKYNPASDWCMNTMYSEKDAAKAQAFAIAKLARLARLAR